MDGLIAEEGCMGSIVEGELVYTEIGKKAKVGLAFIRETIRYEPGYEPETPQTRMVYFKCSAERIKELGPLRRQRVRYADGEIKPM